VTITGSPLFFNFQKGAVPHRLQKCKNRGGPMVLFKKLQDLSGVTGLLCFMNFQKGNC